MIEINPTSSEDKGSKQKASVKKDSFSVARFVPFAPLVVIAVVAVNLLLVCISAIKFYQLHKLQNIWTQREPQRKELEGAKKETSIISEEQSTVNKILALRINWAQKLNILSANITSGMWFTEVSSTQKALLIRGSVISLQKDEMGQINKFIDSLKRNNDFYRDCTGIELGPLQRRVVGGFDILDFALTCTLKIK